MSKILATARPTAKHLAAAIEALAELPESLPEPSSVTIYPTIDPSVDWRLDDCDAYDATVTWLESIRGAGWVSRNAYPGGNFEQIASTVAHGVQWMVALQRAES